MPGRPAKINWDDAFDQFILVHRPAGMTQRKMAELLQVNHTHLCTRFAAIDRERKLAEYKTMAPEILVKAMGNLRAALEEKADYSTNSERTGMGPEFKAKLSLETVKAISDREGLSPQASLVQIQNTNTQNVAVAPIFAVPADDFKALLGGDEN